MIAWYHKNLQVLMKLLTSASADEMNIGKLLDDGAEAIPVAANAAASSCSTSFVSLIIYLEQNVDGYHSYFRMAITIEVHTAQLQAVKRMPQ